MIRIKFCNSHDNPIFIQVDPWACVYRLEKNEEIEFAVADSTDEQSFEVDELNRENRILTLWNSETFFIIQEEKLVHWEDYPTWL